LVKPTKQQRHIFILLGLLYVKKKADVVGYYSSIFQEYPFSIPLFFPIPPSYAFCIHRLDMIRHPKKKSPYYLVIPILFLLFPLRTQGQILLQAVVCMAMRQGEVAAKLHHQAFAMGNPVRKKSL
jgi:hypothetical protein